MPRIIIDKAKDYFITDFGTEKTAAFFASIQQCLSGPYTISVCISHWYFDQHSVLA